MSHVLRKIFNLGIRSMKNATSANENQIPRRQSTKVQKASKLWMYHHESNRKRIKNYAAKSVMKKRLARIPQIHQIRILRTALPVGI